jgi:hypothetical protein
MIIQNRTRLLALVVSSAAVLFGCNTPDPAINAAKQFGLSSDDFSSKTDRLSNDIYDSCIRRITYFSLRGGITSRDRAIANCESLNKPTAARMRSATRLVTNYITSISSLASDNPVKFDGEFSTLKDSLNKLTTPGGSIVLPQNTVEKGTQIGNLIFGWIVNQRRKGSLREAIICTDKPLQEYTMGLNSAFQAGYINGILENERKTAISYYDFYLTRLSKNGSDKEFLDLEKISSDAIQQITTRRDSAESYIAVIDKTAKMHTELKQIFSENIKPLSEAACNVYLQAQDSSSTKDLPGKQTSYSNSPLTSREIAAIRKVAINYQKAIAPLLQKIK